MRMGLWNQCDAAMACNVSDAMWRYYMRAGHVPGPRTGTDCDTITPAKKSKSLGKRFAARGRK